MSQVSFVAFIHLFSFMRYWRAHVGGGFRETNYWPTIKPKKRNQLPENGVMYGPQSAIYQKLANGIMLITAMSWIWMKEREWEEQRKRKKPLHLYRLMNGSGFLRAVVDLKAAGEWHPSSTKESPLHNSIKHCIFKSL